jgi:hypothetical protein
MRDEALLEVWTAAGGCDGWARAGALAAGLAPPDGPGAPTGDAVAGMAVGELNRALLTAFRRELGDRIDCVATCPWCGERLEVEASAGAILDAGPDAPPGMVEIEAGGRRWRLRPPTVADLAAAAAAGSVEEAREVLAGRCLRTGDGDGAAGEVVDAAALAAAAAAAAAALEAADPHAAVRLAVACPACGEPLDATLDIPAQVWAEVDRRANRVVADVAELAGAYGWTEAEVLRLPAARRRLYAELAGR